MIEILNTWEIKNKEEKIKYIKAMQHIDLVCYKREDWVNDAEMISNILEKNKYCSTVFFIDKEPAAYISYQIMSKLQTQLMIDNIYKTDPRGASTLEYLFTPNNEVLLSNELFDLYLLSVCVDEKYRFNKQLFVKMLESFCSTVMLYLNDFKNIDRVTATGVSNEGRALCKKMKLNYLHETQKSEEEGGELRVTMETSKQDFLKTIEELTETKNKIKEKNKLNLK